MTAVVWRSLRSWDDPITTDRLGTSRFRPKTGTISAYSLASDLAHEGEALGASDVIIEVDVPANGFYADGSGVKSNVRDPDFPGVVVRLIGTTHGDLRYACDRFERDWQHDPPGWVGNLRAIVLTLEALRLVERFGTATRGEQYVGWGALPPGTPMGAAGEKPKMTLDRAAAVMAGATDGLVSPADVLADVEDAKLAFRMAAKRYHPDVLGGSAEAWSTIDEAWQLVSAEHERRAA